jgi:hypothetical protein
VITDFTLTLERQGIFLLAGLDYNISWGGASSQPVFQKLLDIAKNLKKIIGHCVFDTTSLGHLYWCFGGEMWLYTVQGDRQGLLLAWRSWSGL